MVIRRAFPDGRKNMANPIRIGRFPSSAILKPGSRKKLRTRNQSAIKQLIYSGFLHKFRIFQLKDQIWPLYRLFAIHATLCSLRY